MLSSNSAVELVAASRAARSVPLRAVRRAAQRPCPASGFQRMSAISSPMRYGKPTSSFAAWFATTGNTAETA